MFGFNSEKDSMGMDKPDSGIEGNRVVDPSQSDTRIKDDTGSDKKKRKRIRIGFGRRKHREYEEKKNITRTEMELLSGLTCNALESNARDTDTGRISGEIFTDEVLKTTDKGIEETRHEDLDKQRAPAHKDMEGKPVYLEDTGEKLGIVHSVIYDRDNKVVGYRIKDAKSDTILSFTLDHFEGDKNGLIFIPSWYTSATRIIEKLEFKDRISPEITALLADDTIPSEDLYNIFLKHDDEMARYIDEAVALKETLEKRLQILEKHRLMLKNNLMDLTEKRLIKDIDRRRFTEEVMEHRRRANILDVNIKKCRELLQRLDKTSFGMIEKLKIPRGMDKEVYYKGRDRDTSKTLKDPLGVSDSEHIYKEKYYMLKERFDKLEEEYNELKNAVEKLMLQKEDIM